MNPIFVYRHKETGNIRCEYLGGARFMEDEIDWEHIDTLEPRSWIELNYKRYASLSKAKDNENPRQ